MVHILLCVGLIFLIKRYCLMYFSSQEHHNFKRKSHRRCTPWRHVDGLMVFCLDNATNSIHCLMTLMTPFDIANKTPITGDYRMIVIKAQNTMYDRKSTKMKLGNKMCHANRSSNASVHYDNWQLRVYHDNGQTKYRGKITKERDLLSNRWHWCTKKEIYFAWDQ